MGRMNIGRVIAGGLLAGLVINAGEFVLNVLILEPDWDALLVSLNREPVGGAGIAMFNLMSFVFGIILVLVYAAIRPRFSPGPRTAVIAGLITWSLSYVIGSGWSFVMGLYTPKLYWATVAWSFFEIPLASLAGAWVYREG